MMERDVEINSDLAPARHVNLKSLVCADAGVQARFRYDKQQNAKGDGEGCDAAAGGARARLVRDFGEHVEGAQEGGGL